MKPRLVVATVAFAMFAHAASARACAAPGKYLTSADGNTVRVLAMDPCSAGNVLLRQDTISGAVMRVTATCVDGWYVDSCVAPGTYRYGFETPYVTGPDCACGPYDYFGVATVNAPLTCASSDIGVKTVPWTDQQTICSPTTSCVDAAPGATCETPPTNGDVGGCNVGSCSGRPWWALGVGLLLLRRRRIMR